MELKHMKKYTITHVKSDSFLRDKVTGATTAYFDTSMGVFCDVFNNPLVFTNCPQENDDAWAVRFYDVHRALQMLKNGDYLYVILNGTIQRVGDISVQDELRAGSPEEIAAPVVNMYVWGSQAMAEWGRGKIVVTASSVTEARDKAERLFMEVVKLKDTSGYRWNFRLIEDERDMYSTEWDLLEELYDEYMDDISCDPYLCTDGFLLIRGSE